jgi:hypothetical protein
LGGLELLGLHVSCDGVVVEIADAVDLVKEQRVIPAKPLVVVIGGQCIGSELLEVLINIGIEPIAMLQMIDVVVEAGDQIGHNVIRRRRRRRWRRRRILQDMIIVLLQHKITSNIIQGICCCCSGIWRPCEAIRSCSVAAPARVVQLMPADPALDSAQELLLPFPEQLVAEFPPLGDNLSKPLQCAQNAHNIP